MSIRVLFFAKIREQLGQAHITVTDDFATVEALRLHLTAQGEPWASALDCHHLLVGVNQVIVPLTATINSGDEVAFFPPVTGG